MVQQDQPFFIFKPYLYSMRFKIPIKLVELENDNYHPVIESVFADGSKGIWVIDSGASKSIFDRNHDQLFEVVSGMTEDLHSAGIGDQPMKSEVARMHSFTFGKMVIENMKVAVLDLSHINELYSSSTDLTICGLLGGDFLVRYKALVDYHHKRLVLRK